MSMTGWCIQDHIPAVVLGCSRPSPPPKSTRGLALPELSLCPWRISLWMRGNPRIFPQPQGSSEDPEGVSRLLPRVSMSSNGPRSSPTSWSGCPHEPGRVLTAKELVGLLGSSPTKRAKFTLTSGKESAFYVDCKMWRCTRGAALIGDIAWQLLDPRAFGGVGGPPWRGPAGHRSVSPPGAGGAAGLHHPKEPKKHGTSQWIEGRELEERRLAAPR